MSTLSDSDLVDAARAGDREAFGAIVTRHQRAVTAVVYAATRDRVLADDLAQEAFVVAWRQLDRLDDPARLSAWLCGIARKQALHTLRWRRREVPLDVEPIAATTPFDQLADHERAQRVAAALARVPESYRDALVLYYGDERSADGVARALGISVAAAHQRLSRGRAHLAADEAIAVERELARKPRRDLVAGVLAAIAGISVLAPASRASAASTRVARAGASRLALVGAAAVVLAGTGYVASVARVTPEAAASTEAAATEPTAAAAPALAEVSPAPARPSLPAPPPVEPARPGSDDDADAIDPALACDALGEHWAMLEAAAEPADAYHPLRRADWIVQEGRLVGEQCHAWSAEARRCVADAPTVYDLMWGCAMSGGGSIGTAPLRLALGRHVAAVGDADLSCGRVASHVATLFDLDPDRLATVPPAYRDMARAAYTQLEHDVPEQTRRDCEADAWSETRRRCYLLTRADYLLGCI